jgi:hypothetical protein
MSVAIDSVKVYVNQFIHDFDYVDAVFLAERLYAEGKINDYLIQNQSFFLFSKK